MIGEAGGATNRATRDASSLQGQRLRITAWALVLIGCGVAWRLRDGGFVADDAWISFRIARNWIEHGILTYDVAHPPTEGMTNLLWTLLSAGWIALWPALDPIVPARILGLLCHLASIALLTRIAAREAQAHGGNPVLAAAIAGGLVATASTMAFSAVSGLETGLWGLLFCCALDRGWVAAIHERASSAIACGASLGLLAWTRPEGVLVGAIATGLFALERRLWPQALRLALVFGGMVALLCSFRLIVYGALVPNTFHAKPPDPLKGLVYLRTFWIYGLGIVGPLAMIPALRRSQFARALTLLCVIMIAGTVWSGGDWMTGFRRFTIATFGIYLLMGVGASLAFATAAAIPLRATASVAVAAVLVGHAYTATTVVQRGVRPHHLQRIAELAQRSPEITQVALVDIGTFGWHFRGSILDLVGLTDSHIATLPGTHGHKAWDEAYFRARAPELVLVMSSGSWEAPLGEAFHVRPFELGVLRSIAIEGGYRYHNSHELDGGRRLLVFAREDVPLDPALWGAAEARDPLAELRAFRARRMREDAARTD